MRILATLCVLSAVGCGDVAKSVDASVTPIDAPAAKVVSITVTGPAVIHAGEKLAFTAMGTFDDASTADVTSRAQWASVFPAATVSGGEVTGVAVGGTMITATIGSVTSNSLPLTVISPRVLIATNFTAGSIQFYAPDAATDAPPLRTISGNATGLQSPSGVWAVNEEVFVANNTGILVFPITGSGNIPPKRSITGAATTITSARGVTVFNNEIYVGTGSTAPLAVFPISANGNVAPTRTIGGTCSGCTSLAVVGNELYSNVANNAAVNVYPVTASGTAATPTRSFTDGTFQPIAMFVAGTEIYIGNLADNTLRVYANTASGPSTPLRTISGMAFPGQVAVYNNELFVPNYANSTIRVFPLNATGAATPTRTLSGASGLSGPLAVFMY